MYAGHLLACNTPNEDIRRAVTLEVIRASADGMPATTELTRTHESFLDQFLSRDGRCVWTGPGIKQGVGLHITPCNRGDTVRLTILWEDVSDLLPLATYFSGFSRSYVIARRAKTEIWHH